jgi:SPW repeat
MTPHAALKHVRQALPAIAASVIVAVTAAPWALGFSASHAAVAAHIAFAMGAGPIAVLVVALPAAAVSTAVAGAWLVLSPWALGYASAGWGAWSGDTLGGLVLIALGLTALRWPEPPPRPDPQPLGDASAAAEASGP